MLTSKFIRWLREAYQAPCLYLPNIYYLDYAVTANTPVYKGGTLRIGAFGATRPQKNLMLAAGAALALHEMLKVDTEFWVSGGRLEGGGNTILNSVKAMVANIPGFTLKELGWATWPQFRDYVQLPSAPTIVLRRYNSPIGIPFCLRTCFASGKSETT